MGGAETAQPISQPGFQQQQFQTPMLGAGPSYQNSGVGRFLDNLPQMGGFSQVGGFSPQTYQAPNFFANGAASIANLQRQRASAPFAGLLDSAYYNGGVGGIGAGPGANGDTGPGGGNAASTDGGNGMGGPAQGGNSGGPGEGDSTSGADGGGGGGGGK
jgi:hypothetical protein